jgi:glycerophosphoryl diester phosphodiesterase
MRLPLPRWIAHRGGGSLAPENTLAGIRVAARLGFKAVEFDVMLSGNGTPVLIHDETLERTTNGAGRVCDTPDSLLFSLDAGQGERIPRLAEAAALCREYGLLANVEIKPAAGHERATAAVVARQTADLWRGAAVQPLLSSFSLAALAVARDLAPEIPRGVLFEDPPRDWLAEVQWLQAVSLHCDAGLVRDEVLAVAREHEIPVLCYTVNVPEQARMLFGRGVSGVFTDRLDLFAG